MARLFTAASTEYLEIQSALVSIEPFTVACWFKAVDVTHDFVLIGIGDKDVGNDYHLLQARGASSADYILAYSYNGSLGMALTSVAYTANVWHHACGVFAASNDRRAYLNGAGKVTDTTDIVVENIDTFTVGVVPGSSRFGYMDGHIAEIAIWNAALTDAEVAILAKGYSPRFVRPQSLVEYFDLIRGLNGIKGNVLTASGTTVSNHPRIIQPYSSFISIPSVVEEEDDAVTGTSTGAFGAAFARDFHRNVVRSVTVTLEMEIDRIRNLGKISASVLEMEASSVSPARGRPVEITLEMKINRNKNLGKSATTTLEMEVNRVTNWLHSSASILEMELGSQSKALGKSAASVLEMEIDRTIRRLRSSAAVLEIEVNSTTGWLKSAAAILEVGTLAVITSDISREILSGVSFIMKELYANSPINASIIEESTITQLKKAISEIDALLSEDSLI